MSKEPSIHEANHLVRVLKGERRKYTARLHYPDGSILEFQADEHPKSRWIDDLRAIWLTLDGYADKPICPWPEGAVLLVEENPQV